MPFTIDYKIFFANFRAKINAPHKYTKIGTQNKKYMDISTKWAIPEPISYAKGKSITQEIDTPEFLPKLQFDISKIGIPMKIVIKTTVKKSLYIALKMLFCILLPQPTRWTLPIAHREVNKFKLMVDCIL